jgi:hypothetical protein
MWRSLAALDAYRRRFEETPDTLTNAVLLGSLIVPLGSGGPVARVEPGNNGKEPAPSLGMLPLARRDVERLRQVLGLQRRLTDMNLSPRARRALTHRGPFREALTWLDIHGDTPEVLEHWKGFIEAAGTFEAEVGEAGEAGGVPPRRRRRRRRRRRPADHGTPRH